MDPVAPPSARPSATVESAPPGPIRRLLADIGQRTEIPFRVMFSDGTEYRTRDAPPRFTVAFRRRRGERRVLRYGHVGLLEAYFDGDVDVAGDFPLAFRAAFDAGFADGTNPLVALRNRWHEHRYGNGSIAQAKANARFHYG